jgi:hypothetical protein
MTLMPLSFLLEVEIYEQTYCLLNKITKISFIYTYLHLILDTLSSRNKT